MEGVQVTPRIGMLSRWLLLCALWARGVLEVSAAAVSFKPSGEVIRFQAEPRGVGGEPEVRLMMLPGGWNDGATITATMVDAHEADASASSMVEENKKSQQVSVISSWVLFHMPGNHTDSLKQPVLPKLVGGLRDAVADALEVCRSSLGIVDMRAINIDVIDKMDLEEEKEAKENKDTKKDEGSTLLEHAASLMRRMRSEDEDRSHVNVTQIKAVYEVRIFKEMRTSDAEVGRRVDKFQIYSKFSDLNRLLGRSLAEVSGMSGVMLDDVGYASRHDLTRPPLSADDLADCAEEVSLHDARQMHQFIMAMSLLLVALITCAGSMVFTIKQASSVPSRMNPLISNDAGS